MSIRFTDEIRAVLDISAGDRGPCLLATADAAGRPDVGYRGSVVVLDDQRLAFWERGRGLSFEHLGHNPQVCVFYHKPGTKRYWRFYGRAEQVVDGGLRARIYDLIPPVERGLDPRCEGVAFAIAVDLVRENARVVLPADGQA